MRSRRAALGLIGVALTILLVAAATVASAPAYDTTPARAEPKATYANPVSQGVVDTFPDPTMIRGKDGAWYAYGTTNPIFHSSGEKGEHILPILRSSDMITWAYAGDVYAAGAQPAWWPANARAFAPDIRYVDGRYYLTYGLSSGGIALVTSDGPKGPWTDHGLIVPPGGSGCPTGNIDQAMFTDTGGAHYLYWGSYDTICVSAMNADATALTGTITQVAQGRRAEGGFVIQRDGHYYLFFSDAGCCYGEFSGYTIKVGRADNPRGPFLTENGQPLTDRRSKGGIVAAANGNGWVGPGHNAIQTDLSGQDWLVYHAIPSSDPNFPPVEGATGGTQPALSRRPLMIDRLDWINGWPALRAGAGPSTGPQTAPVTKLIAGSTFNDGTASGWVSQGSREGRWALTRQPDADGTMTQTGSPSQPSFYLDTRQVHGDVRVQGDLRLSGPGTTGAAGLVVSDLGAQNRVVAWIDRGRRALVVSVTDRGSTTETRAPLPATFDYESWHTVAADLRGTGLTVEVSADGLGDPQGRVSATLAAGRPPARIGAASVGAPGQADNISAAALYRPVARRVPDPVLGALLPGYSDDFGGTGRPETSDPGWSWVRGDSAAATETGGALSWPTQNADLHLTSNNASVLLRDAPTDDFVVETKLGFDGTKGNQQAGILLYENDDRYLKLTHSILPINQGGGAVTHQMEFAKEAERPTTVPPTPVYNGAMFGGPPAETTWLRLAYHDDVEHHEHDVRMASSTDGAHWTWGGSWSMPVRGKLKICLVSMNTAGALATFDYVHTYRSGASG